MFPLSVIKEFVEAKSDWIITHLAEIEKLRQSIPSHRLLQRENSILSWKTLQLRFISGTFKNWNTRRYPFYVFSKHHKNALWEEYLSWLKKQAKMEFEEIMTRIYPLVEPYDILRPMIQVRNMKTLWGSCTTTGNTIRLNLQLMKAPEECIEQVVLHELIHFRYGNHGSDFYALLNTLMPDWKDRKRALESEI